jgi:tRNA A-37 threonylcarbamoyl transferase component Bud32
MSDPFHGLDPAGLMAAAAMPTDGGADTLPLQRTDLPSLEEIAAAFPDLEILGLIGHGGMSAVFKARQPKLDRVVALKVLPKSLAATPGFAERFNREGRVLARLSHPSIVAVHDFGESGGFAYLIMEFVDGVNLRQAMRAGRFTPDQALKIIPAICDALQFAHTEGVLHRDIKPENILLDTTGRVKIADFGIAKILDEKGGDLLLTQSGAKLGTAPYMAPEQIEQPSSVDHRADIYSLGVVFYEMLTGELPLGRFAAPSELSGVGGNIDEIVFRALEKERSRRQQSVDEFKTQVQGASTQEPDGRSGRSSVHQMRLLRLAGAAGVAFIVCANISLMGHLDGLALVMPSTLLNVGGLLMLVSLALWLRLVPINRIWGLVTPETRACARRWYDVNSHYGRQLFWWMFVVFLAGIAGFYQLPRYQLAYVWAAFPLLLVAIVAPAVSTRWWIRQQSAAAAGGKACWIVSQIGQGCVALVVVFFVRFFMVAPYRMEGGGEPGVANNSHWIALRLDTGFQAGNLILYEHESGQSWVARVVKRQKEGLRLKRGGSPDEFDVPWDQIVGKMLFSHFTPDTPPTR